MSSILWVEDQVQPDLPDLFARTVTAGHRVTVVPDATSALAALQNAFDVVIVDIRIDPGDDPAWASYYYDQCTGNATVARLGIQLLRSVWAKNPDVPIDDRKRPQWLRREMVGILTVEEFDQVKKDLVELEIPSEHYRRKWGKGDPTERLLELIERVERTVKRKD